MHEVLVNRLGGLSLPRKSVIRLTDRPDMTLDVYRGRKTTKQQQQQLSKTRSRITPLPHSCCHAATNYGYSYFMFDSAEDTDVYMYAKK